MRDQEAAVQRLFTLREAVSSDTDGKDSMYFAHSYTKRTTQLLPSGSEATPPEKSIKKVTNQPAYSNVLQNGGQFHIRG